MLPAEFPEDFISLRLRAISSAPAGVSCCGLGLDQALGLKTGRLSSLYSQQPLEAEASHFESRKDKSWTCV